MCPRSSVTCENGWPAAGGGGVVQGGDPSGLAAGCEEGGGQARVSVLQVEGSPPADEAPS